MGCQPDSDRPPKQLEINQSSSNSLVMLYGFYETIFCQPWMHQNKDDKFIKNKSQTCFLAVSKIRASITEDSSRHRQQILKTGNIIYLQKINLAGLTMWNQLEHVSSPTKIDTTQLDKRVSEMSKSKSKKAQIKKDQQKESNKEPIKPFNCRLSMNDH